jgi:hypothetical protein
MRYLYYALSAMVTIPIFITLQGFLGSPVRLNVSAIISFEENRYDNEVQKTLIRFLDGSTQTVIETPDQIEEIINMQK